jgi:hypothetical protein
MRRNYQQIALERSYIWIRSHLDGTTSDIPAEFLSQWLFQDDGKGPFPQGFHMSVFAYGFMQCALADSPVPATTPENGLSISTSKLIEYFNIWQLKLGLAEMHRKTELGVAPMPLFRFPAGEQVKYWPKSIQPSRGTTEP